MDAVISEPAAPATALVSALPSDVRSLLPSGWLFAVDSTGLLTYDLHARCGCKRRLVMSYRIDIAQRAGRESCKLESELRPDFVLCTGPVDTLGWLLFVVAPIPRLSPVEEAALLSMHANHGVSDV